MDRKKLIGQKIPIAELRLGDVIRMQGMFSAYGAMTVIGVRPDRVKVFRPYTHIADFSSLWSGEYGKPEQNGEQVIAYTGVEQFEMSHHSAAVILLEAGPTDIK